MNFSHIPLGKLAGVLSSCALLTACYTYQPIEIADITPELEVRTRVTGAEADRLSDVLGSDNRVIEGTVQELQGDNLLLLVPVVSAIDRGRGGDLNQRVELARSGLVEVDVKRLDQQRTGILLGTVTVVVGALVIRQLNQDQGGGDTPDPPVPPEDRVFRFPLTFRLGGR